MFLPLSEQILINRNNLLIDPIEYDIHLVCRDTSSYFIDMSIKFSLTENQLKENNSKHMFLDFYNYPLQMKATLNDREFKPKFLHGRLFLKPDLLMENN